MPKHGRTGFQESWLNEEIFILWLKKSTTDIYSAVCSICSCTINVGSMGRQALISHMKGTKHQNKTKGCKISNIKTFFPASVSTSKLIEASTSNSTPTPCSSECLEKTADVTDLDKNVRKCEISQFFNKDNVTRAEILWCLQTVFTHASYRKSASDLNVIRLMCSDSQIVSRLQLERTKISYTITYGLATYIKEQLEKNILKSDGYFVLIFDESLNKISQSQQMDILIRYWNNDSDTVVTSYFSSVFLKRSRASDLLNSFLAATNKLNLKKLLQLSMDGPNVNKKMYQDLQIHLKEDLEVSNSLLNIGTCGLHTLHNAFKAGFLKTGWDIVHFLRALYNYFKDSPARRGKFVEFTKSNSFPKKFCSVRWLENVNVAQTAIDIIPNLKVYIDSIKANKIKESSNSYKILEKSVHDPLLGAKLAFFLTIAMDLQPILIQYQTNMPVAPFLYSSLRELILKELDRFIIPDKLSLNVKFDEPNSNLLLKDIKLGVGTLVQLKKVGNDVSMKQLQDFRLECLKSLKELVKRLLDKSPVQFKLTKLLTCLDPHVAYLPEGQSRLEQLLVHLNEHGLISLKAAEVAQKEFLSLCKNPESVEAMKRYERISFPSFVSSPNGISKLKSLQENSRIDTFWLQTYKKFTKQPSPELIFLFKTILVLSHGNADVERGFSINKECLIENLKEESLVAQRLVYDFIKSFGGVEHVPIDKKIIIATRNAHSLYKEALKKQEQVDLDEVERINRKRNQILIKELENKKRKLIQNFEKESSFIDDSINKLTSN